MLAIPLQGFLCDGSCLILNLVAQTSGHQPFTPHGPPVVHNPPVGDSWLRQSNLRTAYNVKPFHLFFQSHLMMFISVTTSNWGSISPLRHFHFCVQIGSLPNSPEAAQNETRCGGLEEKLDVSALGIWEKEERSRMLQLGRPLRPRLDSRSWDSFLHNLGLN